VTSTIEEQFPKGTPVRVIQTTRRREASYEAESVGVVEAWEDRPTGSWYAHGKNDKLWLRRLKLTKADGEVRLSTTRPPLLNLNQLMDRGSRLSKGRNQVRSVRRIGSTRQKRLRR